METLHSTISVHRTLWEGQTYGSLLRSLSLRDCRFRVQVEGSRLRILFYPEGPYTLTMELGPKKTIPILVLVT